MNIKHGVKARPQKVVIYGCEGIGKTTLASNFPDPVFFDVEGGTDQLEVARVDDIKSWNELTGLVKEFSQSDAGKTLVIDTIDKAELFCTDYICTKFKKTGIEEFGYGKGYTYLQEAFKILLQLADDCIANGKNVVLLAHAKMRKFEQPDEMGAYDRWEMKLTKQVAPLVKEWADMVLFLNYQTTIITTSDNKRKATGGKRVIYTNHHPCWDAKNRHGLPEELPLEWSGPLAEIFTAELPVNMHVAEAVMGGKTESLTGQEVKRLTPAETVRELSNRNGFAEASVLDVLKGAEMCANDVETLEQVPEDALEMVIQNWEDFKQEVDVPF